MFPNANVFETEPSVDSPIKLGRAVFKEKAFSNNEISNKALDSVEIKGHSQWCSRRATPFIYLIILFDLFLHLWRKTGNLLHLTSIKLCNTECIFQITVDYFSWSSETLLYVYNVLSSCQHLPFKQRITLDQDFSSKKQQMELLCMYCRTAVIPECSYYWMNWHFHIYLQLWKPFLFPRELYGVCCHSLQAVCMCDMQLWHMILVFSCRVSTVKSATNRKNMWNIIKVHSSSIPCSRRCRNYSFRCVPFSFFEKFSLRQCMVYILFEAAWVVLHVWNIKQYWKLSIFSDYNALVFVFHHFRWNIINRHSFLSKYIIPDPYCASFNSEQ